MGRSRGEESVIAVIPCWNEPQRNIVRTVSSVAAQTRRVDAIIIVDDASSSPVQADMEFENARVVRTPMNLGISASRNFGAEQQDATYILFINCGITIPPDWLRILLRHASKQPRAAICTTRVVSESMSSYLTKWRYRFLENAYTRQRTTQRIPWVIGHVMLVRHEAFASVQGFDESLRLSQEDGDISVRLRKAGYDLWQVDAPDAICHQEDTVDLMARKCIRNRGWSLSSVSYAGRDLRSLSLPQALYDQHEFLRERLIRNLGRGRIILACYDVVIWMRAKSLLKMAWNSSPTQK